MLLHRRRRRCHDPRRPQDRQRGSWLPPSRRPWRRPPLRALLRPLHPVGAVGVRRHRPPRRRLLA